jgi:rhomboid protease GluP
MSAAPFAVEFRQETSLSVFAAAANNPYRLRGKGSAQVVGPHLILEGPRTRPFWFAKRTRVEVPLTLIRDVRQQGRMIAFDVPGRRTPMTVTLRLADEQQAAALAGTLPHELTQDFVDRATFETRLAAAAKGTPVAWTMLTLNVAAFVAFAGAGGGIVQSDSEMLVRWGSNFGPFTTDGQWWRLLSAAFLHGGLVHLLVNMYTLYDFGRMSERIFGPMAFLAIYLLSALVGSATSVWWNPAVNSVGASGALFGVLGAMLAYMLDKRNGVPPSVMTTHLASVAVFVAYGIFNGLAKTGIDNAAHLGGLAGGMITGFALARPLGGSPAPSAARRAAGVAACAALILGLAFLTPNSRGAYEIEQSFIADLNWLGDREKALNASANDIIAKAKAGAPDAELSPRVREIASGWSGAHERISAHKIAPTSRLAPLHTDLSAYTNARSRAYATMARVFDEPGQGKPLMDEYSRLMKEGDIAIQRIRARNEANRKKK